MARRTRVKWSPNSKEDLKEIRRKIGARDSPRSARSFTGRIIAAVENLRDYPEAGSPVEDLDTPGLRETFIGSYRVLYRFQRPLIEVLAVRHGGRLLGEEDLSSE